MNGGILLVDADDSSITLTWPAVSSSSSSATKYSLQYRPATSSSDNGIDSGGSLLYTSLSTDLTHTTAKKRNLTGAGFGFWFRVSATTKSKTKVDKRAMEYMEHACRRPFQVLSMMEQGKRMPAPFVKLDSSASTNTCSLPNSYVIHVSWPPCADPALVGYKLQMRENDGSSSWTTVAANLSGTEVRKKNLTSKHGYMFRVRPVIRGESGGTEDNLKVSVTEGGTTPPYSGASNVVGGTISLAKNEEKNSCSGSSATLSSDAILKLFKGLPDDNLLAKGGGGKITLTEALTDVDLLFFYVSAQWCGPCCKYTPQLVKFYNEAKSLYTAAPKRTKKIEIIFVSGDHDLNGFKSYYATMPWPAVPFESNARDRIMSFMKVTGIPRLLCLDGRTGKTLENNSVGRSLDLSRFAKMLK